MAPSGTTKRLLLLASKLGYQTRSFADAARRLGVEVEFGTDRCGKLEDPWGDGAMALPFEHPEAAGETIAALANGKRFDGVIALGDQPVLTAAHAASRLGLKANSVAGAENCRTKLRQREVLAAAGLPVPEFFAFDLTEPVEEVAARAAYPCVVKPLALAASQGVIRADGRESFAAAVTRIRALVESPPLLVHRGAEMTRLLVERYIPGREVAVEGLLNNGRLRVLAIFDKPDPLEGPFFEETIYVTPSRLTRAEQENLAQCAQRATAALSLSEGPLHAEFRVNAAGPWVLEVQPRPIGGLCARALRFGPERAGLEELLVRHALGLPGADWEREATASGVMMIPVPRSGIYERVEGLEEARGVEGVTGVEITAREHDPVLAWPEGSSYLGFVFASGEAPETVERALREAHAKLRFVFSAELSVEHPAARRPAGS